MDLAFVSERWSCICQLLYENDLHIDMSFLYRMHGFKELFSVDIFVLSSSGEHEETTDFRAEVF